MSGKSSFSASVESKLVVPASLVVAQRANRSCRANLVLAQPRDNAFVVHGPPEEFARLQRTDLLKVECVHVGPVRWFEREVIAAF